MKRLRFLVIIIRAADDLAHVLDSAAHAA